VWDKVAADVAQRGKVGVESIYREIIDSAFCAWLISQDVDDIEEEDRKERDELIELVPMAERLAKFFGGWRYAGLGVFAIAPLLAQHDMMPLHELAQLHAREAELLRQLISNEDKLVRPWLPHISRERGKRQLTAFMYMLVYFMRELSGKPQYDAVALMTNIHFPDADVTAENVRNACRPTSRRGRKGGAPNR
jgi:hypothetical protein